MRDKDAAVARVAGSQHGVITAQQLLRCGLDRRSISRRVAAGRLHRLHRGVYAVGHRAVGTSGLFLAAALAVGDDAVVSHRAAGHLLRLVRGAVPTAEVTAPGVVRHVVPGVLVHRTGLLHPLERSVLDGVPVTTVPRTLVDLAGVLDRDALMRACHEAWVLHRAGPERVAAVLERAPNRRGTKELRRILSGDARITLSKLESGFLAVLGQAGLALPGTNHVVGRDRVDCHWPGRRLVVELDSYRFHASRRQWEEDMRRERRARAAGLEHRRYSWADVFEDPAPMLADLRELLAA